VHFVAYNSKILKDYPNGGGGGGGEYFVSLQIRKNINGLFDIIYTSAENVPSASSVQGRQIH
jgi:hypothetical protein